MWNGLTIPACILIAIVQAELINSIINHLNCGGETLTKRQYADCVYMLISIRAECLDEEEGTATYSISLMQTHPDWSWGKKKKILKAPIKGKASGL